MMMVMVNNIIIIIKNDKDFLRPKYLFAVLVVIFGLVSAAAYIYFWLPELN